MGPALNVTFSHPSKKINDTRIDLHNNDYIVSFYESLMQDNIFS